MTPQPGSRETPIFYVSPEPGSSKRVVGSRGLALEMGSPPLQLPSLSHRNGATAPRSACRRCACHPTTMNAATTSASAPHQQLRRGAAPSQVLARRSPERARAAGRRPPGGRARAAGCLLECAAAWRAWPSGARAPGACGHGARGHGKRATAWRAWLPGRAAAWRAHQGRPWTSSAFGVAPGSSSSRRRHRPLATTPCSRTPLRCSTK
jgi:hypothetical protein